MALFKKDSDLSPTPIAHPSPRETRPATTASARTHIAAGSHIEGNITGKTEVLVDGYVGGQVQLEGRFVVGRRGRIQGDVNAQSVQIAGKVKGTVKAAERIEVASSGSVQGDLAAPLVSIAEGGVCNGRIEMSGTLAINSPAAPDPGGPVLRSG